MDFFILTGWHPSTSAIPSFLESVINDSGLINGWLWVDIFFVVVDPDWDPPELKPLFVTVMVFWPKDFEKSSASFRSFYDTHCQCRISENLNSLNKSYFHGKIAKILLLCYIGLIHA